MRITRRRWRRAGATAITVLAAALTSALAAPASAFAIPAPVTPLAQFPGYTVVDHESASTSGSKPDTASCPSGKVVIGAGVSAANGSNDIRYESLIPSTSRVDAYAYEDSSGNPNSWRLKTRAICAVAPAGYEIVASLPTWQRAYNQVATASCPDGKDVLGTGWKIDGGYGFAGVTRVRPTSGDDVEVEAHWDSGGLGVSWSVTAYAICASGVHGQTVQSGYKGSSSGTHGGSVTCPSGTVSLGAGFEAGLGTVGDPASYTYPAYTVLEVLLPGSSYNGVWLVNATVSENDTGMTNNWGMTMHHVCADTDNGQRP